MDEVDASKAARPTGPSLKNRIRSLRRLLSDENVRDSKLPRSAINDKRRLLRKMEAQLEANKQSGKERKLAIRYHKIKFFERQKLERQLNKLDKAIQAQSGAEATDEQLRKRQSLLDKLAYVKWFPKSQKYVSLFPKKGGKEDPLYPYKVQWLTEWAKRNMAAGEQVSAPEKAELPASGRRRLEEQRQEQRHAREARRAARKKEAAERLVAAGVADEDEKALAAQAEEERAEGANAAAGADSGSEDSDSDDGMADDGDKEGREANEVAQGSSGGDEDSTGASEGEGAAPAPAAPLTAASRAAAAAASNPFDQPRRARRKAAPRAEVGPIDLDGELGDAGEGTSALGDDFFAMGGGAEDAAAEADAPFAVEAFVTEDREGLDDSEDEEATGEGEEEAAEGGRRLDWREKHFREADKDRKFRQRGRYRNVAGQEQGETT